MNKIVRVDLGERSYDIVIGNGVAERLPEYSGANSRQMFVFDDKTFELYANKFECAGNMKFSFGRGEKDKTFEKNDFDLPRRSQCRLEPIK